MKQNLLSLSLLLSLLLGGVLASHGQAARKDAEAAASAYVGANGIDYDAKRNIYINKADETIHMFLYEDGNFLLAGCPTTATDHNKFELHLYTKSTNKNTYLFTADGSYKPVLTIVGGVAPAAAPAAGVAPETLVQQDFAKAGPYTTQVILTLKRSATPSVPAVGAPPVDMAPVVTQTVSIANSIHASIGTGFVYSNLKNPTNITQIRKPNGDSTLIADGTHGSATLAIMATLYPWGRNSLLLPTNSLRDRLGIVVGTTIASSAKNFKNIYLGLQYDFAIGGSFVGGVDVAERQKIYGVDYQNFSFGDSKFTGKVNNKLYKEIGVGFFVGVQVDSRIFARMFGI